MALIITAATLQHLVAYSPANMCVVITTLYNYHHQPSASIIQLLCWQL